MAKLTIPQIESYAVSAGFTGASIDTITAIALCESGGDTMAQNSIGNSAGIDRGLLQINSYYHREVSDACAYDPLCAMKAAYTISSGGLNFSEWSTYPQCSGSKLAQVKAAMSGKGTSTPQKGTVPLWCKPFMAMPQSWWEANSHHYPKDWASAEGGVDWNPEPLDAPITALLPGTVVGSGYFCKPNQFCNLTWQECQGTQGYGVVTIRSANPYPDLVPGSMIDVYYQHIKIDPSINLTCAGASGQQIAAGQKIGTGNGEWNIEVGINVGTQWGKIWGGQSPGPHVDPIPFLYRLISNGVVPGSALDVGIANIRNISSFTDIVTTVSAQAHTLLVDVGGFLSICEALDIVEQFVPFQLPTQTIQDIGTINQPQDFQIFGWDTGIINPSAVASTAQAAIQLPADSMQAILVFTITNMAAFLVRAVFCVSGLILFYALMLNFASQFTDTQDLMKVAETVGPMLA